jgi:hypothetical protein
MTTTTWTLKGITASRGTCDHCGRTLARLFRIADPEGRQMTVGRVCARQMTGWNWTVAHAERVERMHQRERAAEERYGDLWRTLRAQAAHEGTVAGVAGVAGTALYALRDGGYWGDDTAEAVRYGRDCLAASVARHGPTDAPSR